MHSLLFYLYINKKCRGGYQPPAGDQWSPLLVGMIALCALTDLLIGFGILFVYGIFNPFLYDIFNQLRNTPFFTGCNTGQGFFGRYICPEGNEFCLFHIYHLYTWYIFSLEITRYTWYTKYITEIGAGEKIETRLYGVGL